MVTQESQSFHPIKEETTPTTTEVVVVPIVHVERLLVLVVMEPMAAVLLGAVALGRHMDKQVRHMVFQI
jgi:hypothetical protein